MTRKRNIESEIPVSTQGSSAVPARRKTSGRNRIKHVAAPAEAPAASEASEPAEVPTVAQVPMPVVETRTIEIEYQPTVEEIAAVAYLYWEARGCQGGSAEEDWLRAEQELRSRARTVTA